MKEVFAKLNQAKTHDEKIPLYKEMEDLKEKDLDKTPIAKRIEDQQDIIYKEMEEFRQQYIKSNHNLISYLFLLENVVWGKETVDIELAKDNHERLSKALPNHPYNELVLNFITAIDGIKVGKQFIDFSAPDLEGNIVKLSTEIEGKVALLDLWATWCGPCIAKSRTMIPLYNEYKDKGFTIVGIAGEFDNTDRLESFLEKEDFSWLQLVELDKKNGIWNKYGIDNSGGQIFLIDNEGKIIAIDPTAEEVRKELENILE